MLCGRPHTWKGRGCIAMASVVQESIPKKRYLSKTYRVGKCYPEDPACTKVKKAWHLMVDGGWALHIVGL